MFVNSDFSNLVRIFDNHGVRYMVIGGYAVMQYAQKYFTNDLDVLVSIDEANTESVYRALCEFGLPLNGLAAKDFAQDGLFFDLGTPPIRVDFITGIPGVAFDEWWSRRTEVDFDGVKVAFISKQDLIASKRSTGRPNDLLDADLLSREE